MTLHFKPEIVVRPATEEDAAPLLAILNEIIEIGGTTGIEELLTHQQFLDYFLTGDIVESCLCAVDASSGTHLGFQSTSHFGDIPADWVDIGTFVKPNIHARGVGRALFAATKAALAGKNLTAINATIRADNKGGLAYYTACGFIDYSIKKSIPLANGIRVDRVCKHYEFI